MVADPVYGAAVVALAKAVVALTVVAAAVVALAVVAAAVVVADPESAVVPAFAVVVAAEPCLNCNTNS